MTPSTSRLVRRFVTALLAAALSGCAAGSLERAKDADELHDYDVSVVEYTKAVRQDPHNQAAIVGLQTAKLRASQAHFIQGQRLMSQGKVDDAIVELQIATDLNPTNEDAARALRAARAAQRDRLTKEAAGNPTALEQLLAKQRTLAAPGFSLPDAIFGEQIQTGQNGTAREVYLMIGKVANLSITFDPTFQDRPAPVSLLANTMTVREALNTIARATSTFYQVTGPNTIIVVPNTPVKQIEYQQQVVQTFYVQNADPAKLTDLLRTVADVRFEGTTAGLNAISVRDTPDRVAMIGRLIADIDKAPPEVVVDVEILEVDRDRLQEYGLQLASNTSSGQAAGPDGSISVQNDPSTVAALQSLAPANVIVTGIPALYYRLLKTDTNTRTLANPSVQMTDGVQGIAEFGTSVPVPNTTFAPVQQGGQSEQAVTSFTYSNVGVTIKITPRTHADDDVSLALDVLLNNIAGTGFQGLPTFGNRHVSTTVRLKDGQTNILAGLLRNDETLERDGLPGLSSLPGLRDVFSKNHKERTQTDVVVMLTPHILHGLALTEEDLRPLMVPNDGTGLGPGPGVTQVGTPPGRGGAPSAPAPLPAGPGRSGGGGIGGGRGGTPPLPASVASGSSISLVSSTGSVASVGSVGSISAAPALPVTPGWPSGLRTVALSNAPIATKAPR